MKKSLGFGRLLALNAYWVGLSFKWNTLHPLVLPAVLLNYVPESQKNTYLGLLTFAGLVIAMLIQPLVGALSDGWRSRFGRRRPLIVLGTLFDLFFLGILAWVGGLPWLVIGYIGLQLSSNTAQGPAQGLLPDRVPEGQMGVASGFKNFMDMFALIVASLAAGNLLDPSGNDATLIMLVVMGTVAISALITILGTSEEPSVKLEAEDKQKTSNWNSLKVQFKIDFRQNTAYWWLIAQRFAFLLGIYGIQAFAQYYFRDVLQFENPVKQTGDLLAVLTVSLVLLSLAGGWLSDRFGTKKILLLAGMVAAVGYLLLMLAKTSTMLLVYGAVLGAGIGLFLTANWAMASKLAPADQAGKFLGLTNLATAGSGALARLEGPLVDILNAANPGAWWGYYGLFVLGCICALISVWLLRKLH